LAYRYHFVFLDYETKRSTAGQRKQADRARAIQNRDNFPTGAVCSTLVEALGSGAGDFVIDSIKDLQGGETEAALPQHEHNH
jgi:hypothetical protein